MAERYKREQCIDNLVQQIRWIEEIDAHKFPGWGHTVNAMRQAIALLKAQEAVDEKPRINPNCNGLGYANCEICDYPCPYR